MKFRFFVFLLLLFNFSSFSDITGIVLDSFTKKPVIDCKIEFSGIQSSQKTDANGEFRLDVKKEGTYNLVFRHDNYLVYKRNDVYYSGRKNIHLKIELNPLLYSLKNITVTASAVQKHPEMINSTGTFLNSELMRAPGALADVQRIVQNLPSVVSGADNVNEVIVRGGMRNENLFLIDNIDVINPNHFADENSGGGVLSLLNPLLVQKLVFNAGAPPAQYGGKASSVIDVTLREGNNEKILAGADLGITGAGFHIEGPAWKKSNFILSANKSYLDLVSEFSPGTAVPKYWVVQGKFNQSLKNSDLSFLSMYGKSNIEIENGKEAHDLTTDEIISGSSNFLAGINWRRKFSNNISSILTLSNVRSKFKDYGYNTIYGNRDTVFYNETAINEYALKLESEFILTDLIKLKSGLYGKHSDIEIERKNKNDTLFTYNNGLKSPIFDSSGNLICTMPYKSDKTESDIAGAFLSSAFFFDSGIKLIAGIRTGYLRNTGEAVADPRIGISYFLNDKLTLNSSLGIQNQFPEHSELILQSSGKNLKAKRAITGVWGIDCSPGIADINIIIETFYKKYNNLSLDYLHDYKNQFGFLRNYSKTEPGEGKSYGIEFFSEKKLTNALSFSIAYSHSRSYWRYTAARKHNWFRGNYDYRNVLTVTGGYKFELSERLWYDRLKHKFLFKLFLPILPFADRQEFSLKFRYRGGRPYTPYFYDTLYNRWSFRLDKLNSAEMEPYHRLDLRWERRYNYNLIKTIFYFEVQNVYNRKNIWTYLYDDDKSKKPSKIYQLPVFPSGGFIIGF